MRRTTELLLCVLTAVSFLGCAEGTGEERPVVVVYTALDRVYAEPILQRFEQETGIEVLPVYDAEAAKTTGLVNRIIARRDNPDCDVLWNNEVVQSQHLADLGLLAPYESPNAARIPAGFRDPQHLWTGFAARARVIIYNTNQLTPDSVPTSLDAFTNEQWRGQTTIALPYFGTTLTHMAVLRQRFGDDRWTAWLQDLLANDTLVAPGNGPVRDLVAAGEAAFGLTDTDDAHGAILDGKPVAVVLPNDGHGPVLIPNAVSLIANAPNADAGKQLIDFLLSAEVERALAASRSAQIPLGTDLADVVTPWDALLQRDTPGFDTEQAAADKEAVIETLRRVGFGR